MPWRRAAGLLRPLGRLGRVRAWRAVSPVRSTAAGLKGWAGGGVLASLAVVGNLEASVTVTREAIDREMTGVLQRAKGLIEVGSYEAAERTLEEALPKAEKFSPEWHTVFLLLLGKLSLKLGKHVKAEERLNKLVEALSRQLDNSPALERMRLWVSMDLAQLYAETGRTQQAEERYKYCLYTMEVMEVDSKEFTWAVETMHSVLDGYSLLLVKLERLDEALEKRREAHRLKTSLYGDTHEDHLYDLNEMGRILAFQGKDEEALKCFTRAIDISEKVVAKPAEVVALRVNAGLLMIKRGLYKKAVESCRVAFDMAKEIGSRDGASHAETCISQAKKFLEK